MKTLIVCCVQLLFVVFCLATCAAEPKEPKRSRQPLLYALTPSLRVGRRSEGTWDSGTDVKRRIGKMVSFPRIGRSDENNYGAKRPGANSGMWFGPRLGRIQKRNIDEYSPWTYIILNGEGPISRQVHYTPRLGRESDEVYEDFVDTEDAVA